MSMVVAEGQYYTRFTASGNIALGGLQKANLFGVLASNANAAGLSLTDQGNGNANITNNVALTSGLFLRLPCQFTGQLNVTLSVGADITVFWAAK